MLFIEPVKLNSKVKKKNILRTGYPRVLFLLPGMAVKPKQANLDQFVLTHWIVNGSRG